MRQLIRSHWSFKLAPLLIWEINLKPRHPWEVGLHTLCQATVTSFLLLTSPLQMKFLIEHSNDLIELAGQQYKAMVCWIMPKTIYFTNCTLPAIDSKEALLSRVWEGTLTDLVPLIISNFPSETNFDKPLLKTSSAKQKRRGERGSPCLTPLYT
jgi:hypothetical protein